MPALPGRAHRRKPRESVTPWPNCTIVWDPPAAAALDALNAHDPRFAERLHHTLGVYALTGLGDVRRLKGQSGYRLRVGDWRVVFDRDLANREIYVRAIAHRRDVYRP